MNFRHIFIALLGINKLFAEPEATDSNLRLVATNNPTASKNILDYLTPQQRKCWLAGIARYDHVIPKQLTNQEKIDLTNVLNSARANVNPSATSMKKVTWYPELEDALVKFRNDNNGSIFFSLNHPYPNEYPGLNVDFLMDHLMQLPEFEQFKDNCRMWYHDTNENGVGKVLLILRFRINQENCILFYNCSPLTFDYFSSCLKLDQHGNIPTKCIGANRYYADMMDEQYDSFAAVLLGIPGPFSPNCQPDSHLVIGCNRAGLREYRDDIPFNIGPSASKCPPEAPVATGKLCLQI